MAETRSPEAQETVTTRDERAQRRTRQRFARRQWARRWMRWRIVLAGLVALVLVGTGVWLVFFSSTLSVRAVEVRGNQLLSDARITRVAAVPEGEQLALVDLAVAERRVETLAEVKDADVTRAWPDQIVIDVTERTAVAVVDLGGQLQGLDADGIVFRTYKSVPAGMPRVRPQTSAGTDALKEAAQVVSTMPDDLSARVDHVQVQTIDQITLALRDGRQVRWGSASDSEIKARVLTQLLTAAPGAKVYDVSVPSSPTTSAG